MVKGLKKPPTNPNTPQNSPNLTPKLDSKLSKNQGRKESQPILKPKSQIDKDYYQKHKEKKKAARRKRYQQQKELAEQQAQEQTSKYYEAEAIKILISFKEYTELNQQKKQLWQDFNWTLQDCQESIKEGYADVVAIMKLEQVSHKLVRDYWDTAKSEEKPRGRNWNSLDYDEQQRLIRYWGYEKARVENGYLEEEEKLQRQSKEYLKELELAKIHEERGKVKCPCYACEEKKALRKEVKAKIDKELKELEKQEKDQEKGECCVCGKIKILGETGACKKCSEDYEN